jgi:hypothetical protein
VGAFAGFDIKVGSLSSLNFQSGFPVATAQLQGQQQLQGYFTPGGAVCDPHVRRQAVGVVSPP